MPWQRKRHRAQQFAAGEDVFHDYRWPVKDAPDAAPANGPGGRPRFDWTPRRSRELIRLIIHTDIRFDDIAAAMKDESGHGPSESTCRDHWHEIFGYTPDVARLKNPHGRARRFKEHEKAFKAYCSLMTARNRCSAIRSGSNADLDDSLEVAPDTNAEVPENQRKEPEKPSPTRSLLSPVQQLRKTIASPHESLLSTRRPDVQPANSTLTDLTPKCPGDVEKKYGLPQGFIPWIKGASISSTESIRRISANTMQSMRRLSSRARFDSVANVASHPNYRQPSVLSGGSMLCNYLSSLKPEDDISVSEVERLINQGEDVNRANENGESPLHLAVALGSITVVAMLLEQGADPHHVTSSGESIWARGRKASVAAIDPNTDNDYARRRMEIQRIICARVEFARTTVRYNPELITEPKPTKRPRHHGSMPVSSSALPQVEEIPLRGEVPWVNRPRLESVPSHIQPWPGPDYPDDSTTTDSDVRTRSSFGPYTPDAMAARNSSDTDWSDLPRLQQNAILAGHRPNNAPNEYALPGPQYPMLFENFTIANQSSSNLANQQLLSHYGTEAPGDSLGYVYDPPANLGVPIMTKNTKAAHAQNPLNTTLPGLNVQSPQGEELAPSIDFVTDMFDAAPAMHADRSRHMPPPPLPPHVRPNLKVTSGANDIPFGTHSTGPGMDVLATTDSPAPTAQTDFMTPILDFNTLVQYQNFESLNQQALGGHR